jgi:NTP pyrophosphatase (non-canonical NTP hydrolase)
MGFIIEGLNEYQDAAVATAQYPNLGENILYPMMGLAGESGEAVDKVKKLWRNRNITSGKEYTFTEKLELAKELGDTMWYIAAALKEIGYTMSECATLNIEKLLDRQARNVIRSSGDNR